MCVLCVAAGKAAGGAGCVDAAPGNDGASGGNTNAPQPGSGWRGIRVHRHRHGRRLDVHLVHAFDRQFGARLRQRGRRPGLVSRQPRRRAAVHVRAERLRHRARSQDPYLRLFNASGNEIVRDDDSGPLGGAKLTFTASRDRHLLHLGRRLHHDTGQYLLTMNDGATPFMPVVSVSDVADFLTNTYWELNGARDRHWGSSTVTLNVDGLEPERAALARIAFQLWSDVANLTFVETHGGAEHHVRRHAVGRLLVLHAPTAAA